MKKSDGVEEAEGAKTEYDRGLVYSSGEGGGVRPGGPFRSPWGGCPPDRVLCVALADAIWGIVWPLHRLPHFQSPINASRDNAGAIR